MQTHINILELSVVVRLVSRLVAQGKSLRVVVLVDSNVVRCAASKGRSSSKALSKALNRLAALSVLGGIYLVLGFAPTRLNPSDDPTRDVALRDPSPGFDLSAWGRRDLYALASLSKLRRPFSNWVSVCLGPPFVTVLIALSFVCLLSLLGCLSRVTLFHLINSNLSWTLIRPLDFLARGLSLSLLALALDPLNVGGS